MYPNFFFILPPENRTNPRSVSMLSPTQPTFWTLLSIRQDLKASCCLLIYFLNLDIEACSKNYMPHVKQKGSKKPKRLEGKVKRSAPKPSGQVEKTTQPHRLSTEWGSRWVHSLALWCIFHIPVKTIHSKSSEPRFL